MITNLSIFIITKNEEKRLPLVLQACSDLTNDLIVVDSGSTDMTLSIAKDYQAQIYHKDWDGFGAQKVFAEKLCKNDWILNLDADEILTSELRQEIKDLIADSVALKAGPAAYNLRIRHVSHLSHSLRPRFLSPVNITPRLYNKNRACFKDSSVHDKVVIKDGSIPITLKSDVAHISTLSFAHMWIKIYEYAELQAHDWIKKGRNPHWTQLIWDPPLFFVKNFFIRRMCFLGWEGFVISCFLSTARMLRISRTMEIRRTSMIVNQCDGGSDKSLT